MSGVNTQQTLKVMFRVKWAMSFSLCRPHGLAMSLVGYEPSYEPSYKPIRNLSNEN